jgi:hypothetical protein
MCNGIGIVRCCRAFRMGIVGQLLWSLGVQQDGENLTQTRFHSWFLDQSWPRSLKLLNMERLPKFIEAKSCTSLVSLSLLSPAVSYLFFQCDT